MLEVYVLSRSRWQRSQTLREISGHWDQIYLVVPEEQERQYRTLARQWKAELIPLRYKGIAQKRQLIGRMSTDKFVMLDDDLEIRQRKSAVDPAMRKMGETDYRKMFRLIDTLLDRYKHVSVKTRSFSHSVDAFPFVEVSRPLRILAYRRKEYLECEHGRAPFMEDFDIALQMFYKGYKNAVITEFTSKDIVGMNAPGGCSDYRTLESHNAAVRTMHTLHPKFTKVVTVKKEKWAMKERLELRIQWKKAYESALAELM